MKFQCLRAQVLAGLLGAAMTNGTQIKAQVSVGGCVAQGGEFCSAAIDSASVERSVQITAQAAGAVSAVEILTLGLGGLDFRPADGAVTCLGKKLAVGVVCEETVGFSPAFSGARKGAVVLLDGDGRVLGTSFLSGSAPASSRTGAESGAISSFSRNRIAGKGEDSGNFQGDFRFVFALDSDSETLLSKSSLPEIHAEQAPDVAGYLADLNDGRRVRAGRLTWLSAVLNSGRATYDAGGNVCLADRENLCERRLSGASGFILRLATEGDVSSEDSIGHRAAEIRAAYGALNMLHEVTDRSDGRAQSFDPDSGLAQPPDTQRTLCPSGSSSAALEGGCAVGVIWRAARSGEPLASEFGNESISLIALFGEATPLTPTTTVLASNPNPSGFGAAVALTATVSAATAGGNLTGAISFFDGSTALETDVPVGANLPDGAETTASAEFNASGLTVGSHSLTATYNNANDSSHAQSTSAALVQAVLEGTATSLQSSANPSAAGASVTFTAAVTILGGGGVPPDGAVVFTDGSATLCTTSLSAGGVAACIAPLLANGLHSIVATYGGDAGKQISGSISSLLWQDVLKSSSVAVVSSPNPSSYGGAVTFTATVTPTGTFVPTGTVNLLDGGKQIGTATLSGSTGAGSFISSLLSGGTHAITAVYLGDTNNAAATSAVLTQVVNPEATATGLAVMTNPAIAGAPTAMTATVTASNGAAPPAGTVAFRDTFNGATVSIGSAPVEAGATAGIQAPLAAGLHSIVAAYSGDGNDAASASLPHPLAVAMATTSILLHSTPNPSSAGSPVMLTAAVTGNGGVPAGSVTFEVDGNTVGSSALNAIGTATLSDASLAEGTHLIAASYSGDANDEPSASAAIRQVVGASLTVTTLTASSATASSAAATLTATVKAMSGSVPTGSVTFLIGDTAIGSANLDASGVASLMPNLPAGTDIVVAAYAGSNLDAPSMSQPVTVSGGSGDFTLGVLPSSVTVATTQSGTIAVGLASINNFSGTIGLACGTLPAAVSCSFSSANVSLPANTVQTATLTIETGGSVNAASAAFATDFGKKKQGISGLSLPSFVISAGLFFRRRRRLGTALLTAVLFSLHVTGCGIVYRAHAAPGTYSIQVNGTQINGTEIKGTGMSGDLIRSQTVTLIVTQ